MFLVYILYIVIYKHIHTIYTVYTLYLYIYVQYTFFIPINLYKNNCAPVIENPPEIIFFLEKNFRT